MSAAAEVTVPRLEHVGRLTQARVARSEWTKLRSLRSTRWSLLVATVLAIGLPLLISAVIASHWGQMSPQERAGHHPLDMVQVGVFISQLPIAVLGVLVITGEYSTGMIRASFTAVPRRLPVLWAKMGVFGIVTLLLMSVSVLVAFFATQAILPNDPRLQVSLSHPGVARAVLGGALYLALVGILALAIGSIVRNTAGGIAAFAAIFFVIPPLLDILPTSWNNDISPYLPDSAGRAIASLTHGSHSLAPGPGLALFLGYIALAVAIAAVLLVRRDT